MMRIVRTPKRSGATTPLEKLTMALGLTAAVLLAWEGAAYAFALGIPTLDGFLTTIETGVPRCGLLMALIGGAGVTLAKFENHFNTFFSGYLNYFVTCGVFGSLVTILASIGVVG